MEEQHDYDGFKPTGSDARLVAEFYAELERELELSAARAVSDDFPKMAAPGWIGRSRDWFPR